MQGILDVFRGDAPGDGWTESRVNMVLSGFGLDEVGYGWESDDAYEDAIRRRLQEADDSTLEEICAHLGLLAHEIEHPVDDIGLWTPGAIRVFLSHSALHKEFVADVAQSMLVHGLHGFVAHDSIEVSREWQAEIERALGTADVFVGLVHPEFLQSAWTNQETGWALGRRLPVFFVRLGADPSGFSSKTQWPSMVAAKPSEIATRIARWVNTLEQFSDRIAGSLIAALRQAGNYQDAGRAAEALNELDGLTEAQWKDLDDAYRANDQVHGGILAHRGLEPLYRRHGRSLPGR